MMENKSKTYPEDTRKSNEVNKFVDKYLYTVDNGFTKVNRNDGIDEISVDRQKIGVDIEFDYNGIHYICDEKAAVTAVNRELKNKPILPTFCLELGFINTNNKDNIGWFLNPNNINNSYMFIWPDKCKTDNIKNYNDLQEVEVCLVRKDKIKEYLDSLGWTIDKINTKQQRIRESVQYIDNLKNDKEKNDKEKNEEINKANRVLISKLGNCKKNGLKFSYSEKNKDTNDELPERPINLLLTREVYRQLSDYNKVIEIK